MNKPHKLTEARASTDIAIAILQRPVSLVRRKLSFISHLSQVIDSNIFDRVADNVGQDIDPNILSGDWR